MNTLQFDYANATLVEYEDFLNINKNIPINKIKFWENIPAQYIKKFSEYDYKIKQVEKFTYHVNNIVE